MKAPEQYPEAAERTFLFRLATELGKTIAELESQLTTKEFTEWAAYFSVLAKEQEAANKKSARAGRRR